MLIERMRKRLAAESKFIEPCLPSPADKPPSGANWIHDIKHDGFRLMARRDPVGRWVPRGLCRSASARVIGLAARRTG
jgi:hypothetical protein